MKRLFIFLVLNLFFLHISFAQKFYWKAGINPFYTDRSIKNIDGTAMSDQVVTAQRNTEVGTLGYSANIGLGRAERHFFYALHLSFLRLGYRIPKSTSAYNQILPIPEGTVKAFKSEHFQYYLGASAEIGKIFWQREKWSIGFSVSASYFYNLYNRWRTKLFYENGHSETYTYKDYTDNYKQIIYAYELNIPIRYTLSNKIAIELSPCFYQTIGSSIASNSFGHRPYTVGINLGANYFIKN